MINCFEYLEQRVNLFRVRFPNPWFLTRLLCHLFISTMVLLKQLVLYTKYQIRVKRNFGLLGLEFPDVFETD